MKLATIQGEGGARGALVDAGAGRSWPAVAPDSVEG